MYIILCMCNKVSYIKAVRCVDVLCAVPCSLRVEGALPGFEVGLSDAKLATLLRVVAGLKKPPSLITHTHAYDELPVSQQHTHCLDHILHGCM